MKPIHIVPGGVACRAAETAEGWIAAVAVMSDADAEYVERLDAKGYAFKPDRSFAAWSGAVVGARARLSALTRRGAAVTTAEILPAGDLRGFCAAGGETPGVLWVEADGPDWSLMAWAPDAGKRQIASGSGCLRNPSACAFAGGLWVAAELSAGQATRTVLWDAAGQRAAELEGRRPLLTPGAGRGPLLIVEKVDGAGIALEAWRAGPDSLKLLGLLPRVEALNLNPSAVALPDGSILVAWESCPKWGWDERVELHREIALFLLEPDSERFRPVPGTANGLLPLERTGFVDRTPQNGTSTRPKVFLCDGAPAVAFKRFRPTGHKGFAWDVLFSRRVDGLWTPPARLTPNAGDPEGDYAVIGRGGEIDLVAPCCDMTPLIPWDREPTEAERAVRCAVNWRVELQRLAPAGALPPVAAPAALRAEYVVPPGLSAPAPEPPPLPRAPKGLTLYWGDFHAHTAYSKCMSPNDGTPLDMMRFQRDVLGCRVLCLTDHVEYMSFVEATRVIDTLLAEAGTEFIPLLGVEYARPPAHHINLYAVDRDSFLRMRCILMAEPDSRRAYARLKAEMPAGSVMAIRHFHGHNDPAEAFATAGPRVTELHDPALEPAMEAMQTRGNMLTVPFARLPLFPTNYLNAGARIGLVGGSDHSRGFEPNKNRFCLTGLWLSDPTPAGVFEAVRTRRTFASANGKIALAAELAGNGRAEGEPVRGPLSIAVRAACAWPIRKITLLRDGQPVAEERLEATTCDGDLADPAPPAGRHWYAAQVEADSALAGRPALAYSAPVFVEVAG
jgi:hypothetical protein